ncbi:MAG: hypothetical protein WCI21_03270 [Alphaproteobacteria bacterium]
MAAAALVSFVALSGCGEPKSSKTAEPSVAQLQASAAASEAEADRLLAEVNASPAQAGALAAGDEKLKTGQYYDTLSFDAQPGQTIEITYDAKGYQAVFIVLGPDNKPDSESDGPAPGASGVSHIDDRIDIDRAGTWHALLSASAPGATGSYEVRVNKITTR